MSFPPGFALLGNRSKLFFYEAYPQAFFAPSTPINDDWGTIGARPLGTARRYAIGEIERNATFWDESKDIIELKE